MWQQFVKHSQWSGLLITQEKNSAEAGELILSEQLWK